MSFCISNEYGLIFSITTTLLNCVAREHFGDVYTFSEKNHTGKLNNFIFFYNRVPGIRSMELDHRKFVWMHNKICYLTLKSIKKINDPSLGKQYPSSWK